MKVFIIIMQITILYVFSFIGNVIHDFFHLIIPGSIVALLLLFSCLCLKIIPSKFIENGASFLLSVLMLFFIPSAVGIMNYPTLLSVHGVLLIAAVLVSTIFSIAISGAAGQYLEKLVGKGKDKSKCNKFPSQSA